MPLTTLVLLSLVSACITLICNKLISANVYKRTVLSVNLKESPYSIIRMKNSSGEWGYAVTKDGEPLRVTRDSDTAVYSSIKGALYDVNIMESLEGYKLSKIEVI